ncbi:speedy protein A-like [Rhopilema esculentum]|uniref:speedy protein A-like n=1 Tax=Rhopilema esculentum TaxID=499914 RepID=UPI0031D2400C
MGNFLIYLKRTDSNSFSKSKMKNADVDKKEHILTFGKYGKRAICQKFNHPSPRSLGKGMIRSKKLRTSEDQIISENLNMDETEHFPKASKKERYLLCYFKLFDDEIIQDFMWNDGCAKLLDKYLIAMVYVYLRRAKLSTKQYNCINFFAALLLAHDMEEDDEEIKQEIFPWVFASKWKIGQLSLVKRKDSLLKRMNFRSLVSHQTCLEVFGLCPEHPLWQRERQPHHGGAIRIYPPDDELPYNPRGPERSPVFCHQCSQRSFAEASKKSTENKASGRVCLLLEE